MSHPVVHLEIIGTGPEQLRGYYADLFGWEFDTSTAVAPEISEQGSYGFIDRATTGDGTGIPGGIGGGPGHDGHVVFSVGVADVDAALQRAETLGGTRRLGPVTNAAGLVVGHVADPGGHLVGVAGL